MAVTLLNNYPINNIKNSITKNDGSPLEGEIWVYEQFRKFNENNLLPDENWYFNHDYSLSKHYNSKDTKNQVEGQIDFILISKNGILIIEVKGGSIGVEDGKFYSRYRDNIRKIDDPFKQVKNYVHTLKGLIDRAPFVYRAVVFPHEVNFTMQGPELAGYKEFFFSRADFLNIENDQDLVNKRFFNFINELGKKAKRHNVKELNPKLTNSEIETKIFELYPELNTKEIKRLKSELFPSQLSFGYNPDKITNEIILNDNYEILKGLRRNERVMVQGAPGSGKTILATKFLAENLIKQHKGIFFCANKLVRSKIEHLIINQHQLDPNYISFQIYSETITSDSIDDDIDFLIFDEAQEFFNKGLYDFVEVLTKKLNKPKILILYDPEQSILKDYMEMAWYTDYFINTGFTHYLFDEMYRCIRNKDIAEAASFTLNNQFHKLQDLLKGRLLLTDSEISKMRLLKDVTDLVDFKKQDIIILIHSNIIEQFSEIVKDNYLKHFEELTEDNINLISNKIRYTTPIKYRGLEAECVYLITPSVDESTIVQNYIGLTRAMYSVNIILWK